MQECRDAQGVHELNCTKREKKGKTKKKVDRWGLMMLTEVEIITSSGLICVWVMERVGNECLKLGGNL